MAKSTINIAATEHKLEKFADDLGKILGQARNKAEGWLGQRKAIVKHLTDVRDTAQTFSVSSAMKLLESVGAVAV